MTHLHTTQHHHNKTPSCHNAITTQCNHVTTPSYHNTITSQHHHNKRTSPRHYALFTKKQHEELCDTTPPQHNPTTTKLNFLRPLFFCTLFYSTIYPTPTQNRLAFGHHRRVGCPRAFGPLPITIPTHHIFACRWRLQLPAAIKSLFF